MKNLIIGTAGHIDHGKTTLIKALTGRNTDRWPEEQRRGITIDLGFTYIDLPGKNRAGIVDVPGHEKFIHNMAAGVVGMDLVLLVIAADEGIMPQTREHMDILRMLGVEKCIIVLNKCDMVDEEWLELMEEEIREGLEDTFLANAPMVKVSAVTGDGIEELKKVIADVALKEVVPKETETICRLPIDRVFTVAGFGTVVTGTLISGRICKEDMLEIYPLGRVCKVRNIQVHDKNCDVCEAGQRVALNLSNVKKEELYRGCVLGPVNSMKNTSLLDVKLSLLDSSRTIENRTRLHLFVGTSEVLCRAVLLEQDEMEAGQEGFVQLRLEEEIAVRRGDRFVVRFYSPMETIGGGVILETNPRIKKRFRPEVIRELKSKESGSVADIICMHVKQHNDTMMTAAELAKITALRVEEIQENIEMLEADRAISVFRLKKDTYLWDSAYEMLMCQNLIRNLTAYEQEHPYRHGRKKAEVQMESFKKIKQNVFNLVLQKWEEEGSIRLVDEYICTPEHEIPQDQTTETVRKAFIQALTQAGYEFIKADAVACPGVPEDVKQDLMGLLREEKLIFKLNDDSYGLMALLEEAGEKVRQVVGDKGVISIGEARDLFATSRKNAKLILDYTEQVKITRKGAAESEWVKY